MNEKDFRKIPWDPDKQEPRIIKDTSGFFPILTASSGDGYQKESVEDIVKQYSAFCDQMLMNFLAKNGYHPKPTKEYIRGLLIRLRTEGKELVIEWRTNNFLTPFPMFKEIKNDAENKERIKFIGQSIKGTEAED